MNSNTVLYKHWTRIAVVAGAFALTSVPASVWAQEHHLEIGSTTFHDNGELPDSMASNFPNANNENTCTLDMQQGGDLSPQLSWRHVPDGTRSFAVVIYDETASITQWAVYDIPADVTVLQQGLALDSGIGTQVNNDVNFQPGYAGQCAPTGVAPTRHRYSFTVYALADQLQVVNLPNFPPFGESVYQALIKAARQGKILESATIIGYSTTTPKNN
jgi:Raf kinase inhibitor-like YbhB/YbcL family protein